MTLRIGILGTGRLGSLVEAEARSADDVDLAWCQGSAGAGPDAAPAVDVAVDVSHADAVGAHLDWAARTGTDLVLGVTGWDLDLLGSTFPDGPGRTGVLVAPNLALSVALLQRFAAVLGAYAGCAPERVDLAVTETHHRAKVDAPSGTAITLRETLARSSGRDPREVQVGSLRLGGVVGRHAVHYEAPSESLTLTHTAHTRDLFALGALAAARWVHGRPGIHELQDWAADRLDHLFTGSAAASPRSGPPPPSPQERA